MHRLIGVLILILASAGLTSGVNDDLKVFGYDAVCLPKNRTLENQVFSSYSHCMLMNPVSALNDFVVENLSVDEKEVYKVFLAELQNYRKTSQIMKDRLKIRLQESDFKPRLRKRALRARFLRSTPQPKQDEQIRKIFEFANETIDMIENFAIPKSLSDEKFRSCIEETKGYQDLVIDDPVKLRKMNIAIFESLLLMRSEWKIRFYLAFPSTSSCRPQCTSSCCMPNEFVDNPKVERYLKCKF